MRTRLLLYFVILIGLWIQLDLLATRIYVSADGNDSNFGTINSPFKTIMRGLKYVIPGDSVIVRTGTYEESLWIYQSGTSELPISLIAYPGEKPIIDGAGYLPEGDWGAMVVCEGSYFHIEGFEVRNSNVNGIREGGAGVVLKGPNNSVRKLNVHHCWENGITAGGDFSIVEDCMVWENCIKNEKGLAGSWAGGLTAARGSGDGITSGAILRRNTVFNNWGEGISAFEASDILIEDNIAYDNWSGNIYVSDASNVLVQRNLIYNSSNSLVEEIGHVTLADERMDKPRSKNNSIINNLIYNANIDAFWWTQVPGSGLDNVLIAHNTVINGQLVIGALSGDRGINKTAQVANNIFYNENGDPFVVKGDLGDTEFIANCWSSKPPEGLSSNLDILEDLFFFVESSTLAGEVTEELFAFQSVSSVMDQGVELSIENDFFNNPRDMKPDLGAIEYSVDYVSILVYPNPSSGLYNLILSKEKKYDSEIVVFDTSGKIVHLDSDFHIQSNQLDLDELPTGIYILKVFSGQSSATAKIVKK